MSTAQSLAFLLIVLLVTARTLVFKRIADRISPGDTAWAIGSGTLCCTVALWPFATFAGWTAVSEALTWEGAAAGFAKGVLLTALLIAQQKLITHSLSATTYVFPVAMAMIGALEVLLFKGAVTVGGLVSIMSLAAAGVAFATFGHLRTLDRPAKHLFVVMVATVVGFACCDRVGVPAAGWYAYLVYTAIGNAASAFVLLRRIPRMAWVQWLGIAVAWCVPEMFFNYAIASSLPVSYGYLAISLRVPILMLIALVIFKEGRPTGQLVFGLVALAASVPVFF